MSHQQIAARTERPLLSGSDSGAQAHGHGDAGLHATVTNISQLSRATGGKSCKMGLHTEVFHVAAKRINNRHRRASNSRRTKTPVPTCRKQRARNNGVFLERRKSQFHAVSEGFHFNCGVLCRNEPHDIQVGGGGGF